MHYLAFVIVPPQEKYRYKEYVDEVMEPTSENDGENEEGKWDWYQIGGRWTGFLTGYDPAADPANIEKCDICGGTGKRNDELGIEARKKDPTYTCNGCEGKGERPKWPTQWRQYDGDVVPVAVAIDKIAGKEWGPHDIVTPDGKWLKPNASVAGEHEMAKRMLEKLKPEEDTDNWMKQYADKQLAMRGDGSTIDILKKFPDHFVVVLDYHS